MTICTRDPSESRHHRLANVFGAAAASADVRNLRAGVALAGSIAAAAMWLGQIGWLTQHGLSALTLSILLGIVVGNGPYGRVVARCGPGVSYAKQTLLRLGVIFYGLHLTFADVGAVGVTGIVIDGLVLSSTFFLAWFAGTRLLGLDRNTAMLIGAGSAICGAAAVMAAEPVIRGRSEQVTVAVATVVVFGTVGIFLYPALYAANLHCHVLPVDYRTFGIFIGSTVHEVAQVFAAGRSISAQTADAAVITKMVRVMMLAPFLVVLAALLKRRDAKSAAAKVGEGGDAGTGRRITVPWFAIAFCGMVGLNSVVQLAAPLHAVLLSADTFALCIAMAALGLTTHLSAVRRAGMRPLLLATLLFGWLVIGGGLINRVVSAWLAA